MTGTADIQYLKGVGPKRAALLRGMGIASLAGLLYTPPRRYIDRSLIKPAGRLRPGESVTVFGSVADKGVVRARRGFSIFNLLVSDDSGYLLCKWFNQPYLSERFAIGQKLVVSGMVKYDRGPSLVNPEYELIDAEDEELIHTGRIVPLHAVTAGLTTRQYRVILRCALDQHLASLPESLPAGVRSRHRLLPLAEALSLVHFPESLEQAARARRRLAFEELFYLQVLIALQRRGAQRSGTALPLADRAWRARFDGLLRFELTAAQRRVIGEISADLAADRPMHRLLQGDVGSGKTVVALAAILQAVGSGGQAALMAPTELLAEQHFASLAPWFDELGVPAALLTGSLGARDRAALHQRIADGRISVCVGTHAVIQEGVRFRDLALAVIDEQHRFGVRQRAALRDQRTGGPTGRQPHVLVMTATPIPRTLALTLYGDLDVSVIDELPPGRVPVVTRWTAEGNRDKVYSFLAGQIAAGRQAYVVYPVIEESEKTDLKAAVTMHRHLSNDVFPTRRVALVHGRLKRAERDAVMAKFKQGAIDILVATTVIEVGIDIPNATVMLVEQAERYGLSQLHQLRGRVGRSSDKSYCILLPGKMLSDIAKARLEIMQQTIDGFKIAEKDLELRGPGDFWSTRQHGLPALRIANIMTDGQLVAVTRQEVRSIFSDQGVADPAQEELKQNLERFFPDAGQYLATG